MALEAVVVEEAMAATEETLEAPLEAMVAAVEVALVVVVAVAMVGVRPCTRKYIHLLYYMVEFSADMLLWRNFSL